MKKHQKIMISLLTIAGGMLLTTAVMAQGPGGPPGPPAGTSGPIDSGVAALLIGAALYGYRELKKRNATTEQA